MRLRAEENSEQGEEAVNIQPQNDAILSETLTELLQFDRNAQTFICTSELREKPGWTLSANFLFKASVTRYFTSKSYSGGGRFVQKKIEILSWYIELDSKTDSF